MMVVKPPKSVELMTDEFGHIINAKGDHVPVKRFTWKNQNRISVQLITYGATITSIKFPNKKGILDDVVIGFDDIKGYQDNGFLYCGCIVGRYANFISESKFTLGKKEYSLQSNVGNHHFNGGPRGLDKVVWEWYISGNKVVLSTMSPDNDQGYPGDLTVFLTFELTANNEFKIDMKAYSTKQTIVNIAHHTYFNLAGHSAGHEELENHTILLNADCYTLTRADLLPTGEIKSVQGTIYDFQIPVVIGKVLQKLGGMNSNFCLTRSGENDICFVGRLSHMPSGRIVEMYSNQYGVNFDTANNFPHYYDDDDEKMTNSKPRCPYLMSNIGTFDLLDEIYVRVKSAICDEKITKYTELLALIKDLQRKTKTISRSNECNAVEGAIKRGAVHLEMGFVTLTPLQRRYVEKILDVMSKHIKNDSGPLVELRNLIIRISNNRAGSQCNSIENCPGSKCSSIEEKTPEFNGKGIRGKKGARYFKHCGIALQTQNYPDAIRIPHFPSSVLKPGCVYHHSILYKFWVKTDQANISGIL